MPITSLLVAASLSAGSALALPQDVSRVYVSALGAFEDGDYAEALEGLREAVRIRPEPGGRIRRGGAMLIDYAPYPMLAIAAAETGDCRGAFESLAGGGGYDAVLGRADDLGTQFVRSLRDCRGQIVGGARAAVGAVDDGAIASLADHEYVAPRWDTEFEREYEGITRNLSDLSGRLDALGERGGLDLATVDAVTAEAELVGQSYQALRGRVEQASATPPAAPPEPEPEPEVLVPESEPPAAQVAEEEPDRSPTEPDRSPTESVAPSSAEETAPVSAPAESVPSTPTTPERAAAEPAPVSTSAVEATAEDVPERDAAAAAAALDEAKRAFFVTGDLAAVLMATRSASSTDVAIGWELQVLQAAAQFYQYRLGLDDNGLVQAGRSIGAALEIAPAARPSAVHFAPAFVEVFEQLAGDR